MNNNSTITYAAILIMLFYMFLGVQFVFGQETNPSVSSNSSYHNQLFYNRFLINPTFSLVRETKSYVNILHRNQYATFEDNSQNYFLGFSNRLNDNTALGIGVFSQWAGVIQEFGFNANYATSVRLGQKSKLTFGSNVKYFNRGLDKNRVIVAENDPEILGANKESIISIQPGITLSVGKFDFGLYVEDMFKFNQTTNQILTQFNDKSINASLQYTHTFAPNNGLISNARLLSMFQLGRNEDSSLAYLGSILLDLPKYGWLQTTLDDTYGLSMGLGFNLNKKMSLGYLMEKDFKQKAADLGWNHELSLAYTFKNDEDQTENYTDKSEDDKIDRIVRNYEEQILKLVADNNDASNTNGDGEAKNDQETTGSLAYENRLILNELIFRQDSIEEARTESFEKRFETIVRILRNDLKHSIKSTFADLNKVQNTGMVANENEPENIKDTAVNKHKEYVKLPIKVLNKSNIKGVKSGYYVIANVYKNKKYLNAFIDSLNEKGLEAKQFYNKANGLYYVYLADFNFKEDAKDAYVSNLNGKYQDQKWIMQVDDNSATVDTHFED